MTGPPNEARFPHWWLSRRFNLNEVATIIATEYPTAYRWMQLIQATGLFFGEKRGREILFDCHELYALRIVASFHRAGIPVGPAQIRAVVHFCYGTDGTPRRPEGRLIQAAPESEFVVDAVRIFHAVMAATNPEELHAEAHS